MKRALKTEAIVLKKKSLPNQDNIISLFSKEFGKVSVFAKGIKKITSRRLPHVQTANLIKVILFKKDERFFLQESTLVSGFSELKKNNTKLQFLYQYLFVLERLLPENQVETGSYNLFMKFLIELSRGDKAEEIYIESINKLLKLLGYAKDDKSYEELRRSIQEIIHDKMPELHL